MLRTLRLANRVKNTRKFRRNLITIVHQGTEGYRLTWGRIIQ